MLTRKRPETLATELTITGQGQPPLKFNVTYKNPEQDAVNAVMASAAMTDRTKQDIQYPTRTALLFIIKTMESEYPLTDEGIAQMEEDRPGMIEVLFNGWHQARRVTLVKN
jgi:hypothetical protein